MKHRHSCASHWTSYSREDDLVGSVRVRKYLKVERWRQHRHLYPTGGDKPACCRQTRLIIRVVGLVISTRDAKKVAEAILELSKPAPF